MDSLWNAYVKWQEHTVKCTAKISTQSAAQSFRPVWPNGSVFVYKLSGSGFDYSCSHLNSCYKSNIAKIKTQHCQIVTTIANEIFKFGFMIKIISSKLQNELLRLDQFYCNTTSIRPINQNQKLIFIRIKKTVIKIIFHFCVYTFYAIFWHIQTTKVSINFVTWFSFSFYISFHKLAKYWILPFFWIRYSQRLYTFLITYHLYKKTLICYFSLKIF